MNLICPKCKDGNSSIKIPGTMKAVALYDTYNKKIVEAEIVQRTLEITAFELLVCDGCGYKGFLSEFEILPKEAGDNSAGSRLRGNDKKEDGK